MSEAQVTPPAAAPDAAAAAAAIAAAAPPPPPPPAASPPASGEPAANDWRSTISDEALRSEAAIANYASLDDFVKGHLSTKALASSKAPLPGDTPESQEAFAAAIRPQDAAAYEITMPEGVPPEFGDGFRGVAHKIGLAPFQAKAIVEWNNEFIAADLKRQSDASEAEVAGFKKTYGANYDAQLGKVSLLVKQAGLELSDEDLGALDAKLGSANLLRFMFNVADRIGPLEHISGDDNPGMNGGIAPEQADAKLTQLQQDAGWRAKAKQAGTPENQEYVRLTNLAAQHRHSQQQSPKRA